MDQNYLYDDNNRLLDIGDKIRLDYDLQGNLIAKRLNEQVVAGYRYDAENRLTEIETGEARVRYSYDPFGRRLMKEVAGRKTFFHYADEGLVAEFDEQGKVIRSYSWRPGSAWSSNPLVMLDKGKTPYFYYNNHLGAPVKLTDKEGRVVWSATYTAFGKAEITLAKVTNNLRLPGQYFDKETGLHYNFQRYCDPDTGRYITADPIGLKGGINLYAYVLNDPVNLIDPWGLAGSREPRQELEPIRDPFAHMQAELLLREIKELNPNRTVIQNPRPYGYSWEDVAALRQELNNLRKNECPTLNQNGFGNIGSNDPITIEEALRLGEQWLGSGYKEVGPPGSGVYRSADNQRQFRFTDADVTGSHGTGPHVHFESLNQQGRVIENNHIPIVP